LTTCPSRVEIVKATLLTRDGQVVNPQLAPAAAGA